MDKYQWERREKLQGEEGLSWIFQAIYYYKVKRVYPVHETLANVGSEESYVYASLPLNI